ncbi:MAG: helix-turn-helix transcriptional regulator [Clostridia bacterium]|nr:helix-turn-helix transcriptional regulator [Clostridia bacterium]
MNDFQERLQELLEDAEINRLQLSKIIGVDHSTINGYFNKNYYPQLDIAIKIVKYFKCSLDYLFGFSNNKNNENHNNLEFFENLNKLINDSNLSLRKIFKDIKISLSNYFRWRDGTAPKTIIIIEIAKYFNVGLDYLVGNVDI